MADGDHSVTFAACRDRETHWLGGFVAAGAQCVPVDITVDGRTVRRHLPFGVPRYGCPIRRFERGLNAVRFPAKPAWDVRVSGPGSEGPCLRDRVSRAANPRLGVVIAVHQFENPCAPDRPRTLPLRTLPLRLDGTRLAGRFAGRGYDFEVRVFYGRAAPTAEQRQAAQHMLDRARWPRRIR